MSNNIQTVLPLQQTLLKFSNTEPCYETGSRSRLTGFKSMGIFK